MKKYLLLLILPLALLSCQGSTDASKNSPAAGAAAAPDTAKIEQISGLLVLENGRANMLDPKTRAVIEVIDRTGKLDSAYINAVAPCHYDAEKVVASLSGKFLKNTASSAIRFEATAIDKLEPKHPQNMEALGMPFDFWCHGNEPFWSIQISSVEDGIFYENMSDETAWACKWVAPRISGDTWIYDIPAVKGKNEAFSILIKKERSDDGMSDTVYDYSALVSVKGVKFKGVAIRGKGDISGPPGK